MFNSHEKCIGLLLHLEFELQLESLSIAKVKERFFCFLVYIVSLLHLLTPLIHLEFIVVHDNLKTDSFGGYLRPLIHSQNILRIALISLL